LKAAVAVNPRFNKARLALAKLQGN